MAAFKDHVRLLVEDVILNTSSIVKEKADRHNVGISVKLYEDKGVQATVRRIGKNNYRIYMPLGIFYRYALLSYIVRFSSVIVPTNIVLSHTDRRELNFFMPDRLRIIFDPVSEIEDKLIDDLINEYCDLSLDITWDHSIIDAVHILLQHELGHICEGHLEFLKLLEKSVNGFSESTLGGSEFDVRQGFEVAADQHSAMYLSDVLKSKFDVYQKAGISCDAAALEFSLSIGILITLFDCRSRSLDVSSYDYHPHPIIRFIIINYGISDALYEQQGMKIEPALYWQMAKKSANATAARVGGLFLSEMRKIENLNCKHEIVPICPLRFDHSPVNESVLIDFLTRTAERGRRITMRINQHKEFKFHRLAGLRSECLGNNDLRWDHIFVRLRASKAVRDQLSSGIKFSTFYGPVKQ